ncbi:hypothetical protein ACLMJK_003872 [Lecanora helva]
MTLNFNGKPPVIAPGSLILVTGANGFIASHVVDQLLQAGYRVRGTSRDTTKNQWIKDLFDGRYGEGKYEGIVVEDMAHDGAFDEACIGVAGIVHVASVLTFDPDPNKVVPPTIAGTLNLATAASKQPSVKRVVYTSSSTAITSPKPNVKFHISTDDWNTEDVEKAWAPPPYDENRRWAVYGASKTQAEQKLWEFHREKKPNFVLNAVLPDSNFGELLSDKQFGSSWNWVKAIYEGNLDAVKEIIRPQWMVDVKDTARLHVAALLNPGVENERILAFAFPFNWNDILACLRNLYPDRKFADDIKDAPRDLSTLDNSRGVELLKAFGQSGWTSMEESIRQNTMNL